MAVDPQASSISNYSSGTPFYVASAAHAYGIGHIQVMQHIRAALDVRAATAFTGWLKCTLVAGHVSQGIVHGLEFRSHIM